MSSAQHTLECRVSLSLWNALRAEHVRTGDSISHIVERALAAELDVVHHSLFQVSTSAALVEGVFGGCTRVSDLRRHGDFGLGTFDGLDGEMLMLDGQCFQIHPGGTAEVTADDMMIPFATITRFVADRTHRLQQADSYQHLKDQLDCLRPSNNIFVGFRVDGVFTNLSLRAACRAEPGENLVQAIEHQSKFHIDHAEGTLVGFWSPSYSSAISVPGYHFHFINAAKDVGGHVFDLSGVFLNVGVHQETDIHLAIPETKQFLEVDLDHDSRSALDAAEKEPM
ncbi:MAG: acetolactate decarboxylase [Fuerstiella sp.]